jgi:hypothetical protein
MKTLNNLLAQTLSAADKAIPQQYPPPDSRERQILLPDPWLAYHAPHISCYMATLFAEFGNFNYNNVTAGAFTPAKKHRKIVRVTHIKDRLQSLP